MPTNHDDMPLSSHDAEALDSLVAAGFDLGGVPEHLRIRARRVADLLRLLDGSTGEVGEGSVAGGQSASGALVDVTLARVLRTPMAPVVEHCELSEADARALDSLVGSGWDVSESSDPRVGRLADILGRLDRVPVDARSRDDLVARTMRSVRGRSGFSMPNEEAIRPTMRTRRFRLADLASMAAMLLIGASIVWPTLASSRFDARRQASQAGMHNAGIGFDLYSSDNGGRLPQTRTGRAGVIPGVRWWEVGAPGSSHSANLFILVTDGYATLGDLASSGNPSAPVKLDLTRYSDWRSPEEVSYSYQLFGRSGPAWRSARRIVILADKSPVIDRARRGERVDPNANSINYKGRGQHVLFNDASVRWIDTPSLDGDNIWLPDSVADDDGSGITLRGLRLPSSPTDAFVGP